MWYTVKDLSRETGPQMRLLNFMVDSSVLGVQSDISPITECLNSVTHYFQYAFVPAYIENYKNEEMFLNIKNMIINIKSEFVKLIKHSQWFSGSTKQLAIEKIKYLKEYIGYPYWAKNLTILNQLYDQVGNFLQFNL